MANHTELGETEASEARELTPEELDGVAGAGLVENTPVQLWVAAVMTCIKF
jgi:hypothetical protein